MLYVLFHKYSTATITNLITIHTHIFKLPSDIHLFIYRALGSAGPSELVEETHRL